VALLCLRLGTPEATRWTIRGAVEVAFLAVATAMGYALWDLAMRRGDIVFVAACSYLTPFFSTLVACAYLRVVPRTSLCTGCLLIIAGSFLSWISVSERPLPPPDPTSYPPTP
jgi:drug/metabolite transporter (DMT)-like permease